MELLEKIKYLIPTITNDCGKIIRKYYRNNPHIELKEDSTPVTLADKETEKFIRTIIQKEFPTHTIHGEEYGKLNNDSEYKWVIDPIDGTKSFLSGTPLFGMLLSFLKKNIPLIGVIYNPITNDLLIGE